MVDVLDEYFAVTDLAGACRPRDRFDDLSTRLAGTTTSSLTFGRKVAAYSVHGRSRYVLLIPVSFDLVIVMPLTPTSISAAALLGA